MIEAPDFNTIRMHKISSGDALCCIVLAPKFHKSGYEGIISRCEYLDARSNEHIHFYCAGYGAYWNNEYAPYMEPLSISKEIPWCFSQRLFASFVDDMEQETNWRYGGGTDLRVYNGLHTLTAKKCRQYMVHAAKDGMISILPPALKASLKTLVKGRHYILKDISKPTR